MVLFFVDLELRIVVKESFSFMQFSFLKVNKRQWLFFLQRYYIDIETIDK